MSLELALSFAQPSDIKKPNNTGLIRSRHHAFFGDQGRDQIGGRHIEGRVADLDTLCGPLAVPNSGDLIGSAFFNRNGCTLGQPVNANSYPKL